MSAAGALNIVFQGKRSIDYNNTTTNLLHKWAALTKRLHRALKLKYNMFFFLKSFFNHFSAVELSSLCQQIQL